VPLEEAVAKAEAAELDLVEIAPTAKPPVCRIMDYGKFKYREAKKQHEARLKLKQIQVKEVKFRPSTDEGDYLIKLRNLIRFLGEGDKAKITLRFRGRDLEKCVAEINATGYGLTMGLHSRIDARARKLARLSVAGNLYINRNMIGAVDRPAL